MSFADEITNSQNEEQAFISKQRAKCGAYENPEHGCPNCGRHRVMLGEDGKHRCEKCCWCLEDRIVDGDLLQYMR